MITNTKSHNSFKNSLLSFTRTLHFDSLGIYNLVGLQLQTRLRLGLSHLNEHKFKHNFRDFLNALCACNLGPETTFHYLLRCHLFQIEQRTLPNFFSKQLIYTKAVLIQNVY